MRYARYLALAFLGVLLTACSVTATDDTIAAAVNAIPLARAGADQTVVIGAAVSLDGSNSRDPNGDALTYQWSFSSRPDGSAAAISDATSVKAAFTPDVIGTYVVALVVNDGTVDSAADELKVDVTKKPGAFDPPANTVAVNFAVDDTASQNAAGLAWKCTGAYNATARILTYDSGWTGPFPMLYDDGPWDAGGHEALTAVAGDHVWGVTVWVSNTASQLFEYGLVSGSVNGSDGAWIWAGANGQFTVSAGATADVNATGMTLP